MGQGASRRRDSAFNQSHTTQCGSCTVQIVHVFVMLWPSIAGVKMVMNWSIMACPVPTGPENHAGMHTWTLDLRGRATPDLQSSDAALGEFAWCLALCCRIGRSKLSRRGIDDDPVWSLLEKVRMCQPLTRVSSTETRHLPLDFLERRPGLYVAPSVLLVRKQAIAASS